MGWFFHNFAWKVLSILVAFCLWFVVMSSNAIEVTKEIPIHLDLPTGLVVSNEIPDRISFRLQGSKFFLRNFLGTLDNFRVDLSKAKAGPTFYRIEKESLNLPLGVRVMSISPTTITPNLEPVEKRSVPVEVSKKNDLPNGYKLIKIVSIPKNVRIKGPHSLVQKISNIKTPAVDLSDVPPGLKWEIPFGTGYSNVVFDEEELPRILVEVEPTGSNFRVSGVPIRVVASKSYSVKPEKVAIFVNCPAALIKTMTPEKVSAFVDLQDAKAGTHIREVKTTVPVGVKVIRVVPNRVEIVVN